MFTGIVEEIGRVVDVRFTDDVVVLTIEGPTVSADARPGDSIAVSGVCLTVVDDPARDTGTFRVELVPETLSRTSLKAVAAGTPVNLERAVAVGGRLGGHIVQGHVDGVGTLLRRNPGARSDELTFGLPPDLHRYVVEKGSITVDGVSLTVADTTPATGVHPGGQDPGGQGSDGRGSDGAAFTVALIPTTLAHTTLGARVPGDPVNLEVDVVAKYVERLLGGYDSPGRDGRGHDGRGHDGRGHDGREYDNGGGGTERSEGVR